MKTNLMKMKLKQIVSDWINSIDKDYIVSSELNTEEPKLGFLTSKSTIESKFQRQIERDILVMGGCIPSMLLGEKINDFDLYFRTKETAVAVAEYYLKKANLLKGSGNEKMSIRVSFNEETGQVKIYVKSAGTALAEKEDNSDYNYFEGMSPIETLKFFDEFGKTIKKRKAEYEEKGLKYQPLMFTQNAISLTNSIQLIVRFTGEPEEILKNYDYAHVFSYYDYANDRLHLDKQALECILDRRLIYRNSQYPLASLIRMRKFMKREWKIDAGEVLKMCIALQKFNLLNSDVLYDQLMGVDLAYFGQLIQLLEEKKPQDRDFDEAYIIQMINTFNETDTEGELDYDS